MVAMLWLPILLTKASSGKKKSYFLYMKDECFKEKSNNNQDL